MRRHHAVVDDLQPGTTYAYRLVTAGAIQPPSLTNPGVVTTLTPPPGRHLFDVALVNDVHIGESCSGSLATAPVLEQSLPECFMAPEYARQMAEATVAQINALGVDAVIVNGDVSADDRFEEEQTARQILDGLDAPWHVARGNHDRAGQGEADPRCGPDDDCFRTVFFPDMAASATPPTRLFESFEVAGHRFVLLDSNDAAGVGDLTDPQQNAFLR